MPVEELEGTAAVVVAESAPLRVVSDMVAAGHFEAVLVLSRDEVVRGLLTLDAIHRLVQRLPEIPVGMLPLRAVVPVPTSATVHDAARALGTPDVAAVIVEKPHLQGWTVVMRERVLGQFAAA